MMARFEFTSRPGRVLFGAGRAVEIANEVRQLGCRRALVLSTPDQNGMGERVRGWLGDLAVGTFSNATMHTPVSISEQATALARTLMADCTVAIGGGSAIGLSKAIALRTDLPQLVLPTTYAGSEVTPILGETDAGIKRTQRSARILPEVIIYDAELTLSLPAELTATSGMNALAHAVEALYANDANPITSLMAQEAIAALAGSLPALVDDPTDLGARTQAQYGAWLAGTCLGAVGMGLHHKICHVLGGTFNLPHAQTHSVMLPYVLEYNASHIPDALARIGLALGDVDAVAALHKLCDQLPVPTSLAAIGMPADGVRHAVELALQDSYANPRPLEAEALTRMLTRALHGAPI